MATFFTFKWYWGGDAAKRILTTLLWDFRGASILHDDHPQLTFNSLDYKRKDSNTEISHYLNRYYRPPLVTFILVICHIFLILCAAWAKDEPPSPKEEVFSTFQPQLPAADQASNSDFGHNFGNGNASGSLSRWWTFTTPRQAERFPDSDNSPIRELNRKQSIFKDKRRSWLATPTIREPSTSFSKHAFEKSSVDPEQQGGSGSARKPWDMRISMPTRPFTVNQVNSPGWETPWTSRAGAQGPFHSRSHNGYIENEEENLETHSGEGGAHTSKWKDRKKRLRIFLLNNAYVPLVSSLIPLFHFNR